MQPDFDVTRPHLRIAAGEAVYRIFTTPWVYGGEVQVIFRVISKLRRDGRIEVVHYTETNKGKYVTAAHAVMKEEKLPQFLAMAQAAVNRFFPGLGFVEERVSHLPMERLRREFLFETPTVEPH